jgi:hypothetical protein
MIEAVAGFKLPTEVALRYSRPLNAGIGEEVGVTGNGPGYQGHSYQELVRRFRELGAQDPESWAKSESEENIPQLARFCFIRGIRHSIESWTTSDTWIDNSLKEGARGGHEIFVKGGQALRGLLDAGASRKDLQDVARLIAFEATFEVVDRIDEGYDADLDDDYPGWRLIETMDEKETARAVGGLHESLLE